MKKALIFSSIISLIFAIVEYIYSLSTNSLLLRADAFENASDVIVFLTSFFAILLLKKKESMQFTYGFKKVSILVALFNSILLANMILNIFYSSIKRILTPSSFDKEIVLYISLASVVLKLICVILFYSYKDKDLNAKASYLNALFDMIISLIIFLSLLLSSSLLIDPILSILLSLLVLYSVIKILLEAFKLIIDGVPSNINPQNIQKALIDDKDIIEAHDIHIWSISSSIVALSAHIMVNKDLNHDQIMDLRYRLKSRLKELSIDHSTIEIDINTPSFKEFDQ